MKALHTFLTLTTVCLSSEFAAQADDPRIDSWIRNGNSRYARMYRTDANQASGTSLTTWSNGSVSQSIPAYAGPQEILSSSSWIYLRTTGLGLHVMGPWYNDAQHLVLFNNLPINTKTLYRIPRQPTVPSTKVLTGGGTIGYFVDGVAMFDSRDTLIWNGTTEQMGNAGVGYWNRDAYVVEGVSFDPAAAHQPPDGSYHYHSSPTALRYRLGDHVDFDPSTHRFSESTLPATQHSPLLGWVRDGFPVYGPYGFANASNATSGIRRMISGFVLRNGEHGTSDLRKTGRPSLPAWATRLYKVAANVLAGPSVNTTYSLGRYMEDREYLGDLVRPGGTEKHQQGVDFDLDEYNGRWCVTPEFPGGTYAYFCSVASDGMPVFPYNIGRAFFGNPTGNAVTTLTETVTTHFSGGADAALVVGVPKVNGSEVSLVWSAVEGGTYQVESTPDFSKWFTNATGLAALGDQGAFKGNASDPESFFRVRRTAIAAFDPATGSGNNGGGGNMGGPPLTSVSPNSGHRGNTITLTMTLGGNPPPAGLTPSAVSVGSFACGNIHRTSATVVTATFSIPADAPIGSLDVGVTFPGPAGQGDVTFSLSKGFSVL